MKKATLSVCAALAAATLCAARAEPTLQEPNDWEGRVRLSAGGFGRFGTETKIDLIEWSDRGELWGAGLDAQFQLVSDKDLTVWLGVGTSYVPEQEIATLGLSAGGVSAAGKMELKAYGFRVMLIPEVQICEELAMGLRLGLGVSRAEGTGTLTASYAGFSAGARRRRPRRSSTASSACRPRGRSRTTWGFSPTWTAASGTTWSWRSRGWKSAT